MLALTKEVQPTQPWLTWKQEGMQRPKSCPDLVQPSPENKQAGHASCLYKSSWQFDPHYLIFLNCEVKQSTLAVDGSHPGSLSLLCRQESLLARSDLRIPKGLVCVLPTCLQWLSILLPIPLPLLKSTMFLRHPSGSFKVQIYNVWDFIVDVFCTGAWIPLQNLILGKWWKILTRVKLYSPTWESLEPVGSWTLKIWPVHSKRQCKLQYMQNPKASS